MSTDFLNCQNQSICCWAFRVAHTHIFLVACRVAQLFTVVPYVHFTQCICSGSRLDESSQHVSRVFSNLRWLHGHSSISCLVATSWACVSVVLHFLTDWRRNQGSPASIPATVAGLAERLNSPPTMMAQVGV